MKNQMFVVLFFIAVSFVLFGQGCLNEGLQTKTESTKTETPSDNLSGNGGGYEGKPLIYHVDEKELQCNGVSVPKTILIYYLYTNEWYLVHNSEKNCLAENRKLVDGVVFDQANNAAYFNNIKHIPPKAYLVDATANADLPDLVKDDGVCINAEGKCSLRAAFEQGSVTAFTEDVNILIPEGSFKISTPLLIDGAPFAAKLEQRNHKINIIGRGGEVSIIDGSFKTNILNFYGVFFDTVKVSGVGFINGTKLDKSTATGSAISLTNIRYTSLESEFASKFLIDNCYFANNTKTTAVYINSWNSNIIISNSVFKANTAGGLEIVSLFGDYLVENSYFSENAIFGMYYGYASANITVDKSIFYKNKGYGVLVGKGVNYFLKNSIFYQNEKTGLYLAMTSRFYGPAKGTTDFDIGNSIFYENGTVSGGNLDINYAENPGKALVHNSILIINNSNKVNCDASFSKALGFPMALTTSYSYIDDNSCGSSSLGNISIQPKLDPVFNENGDLVNIQVTP